jgi:hypothetical protein
MADEDKDSHMTMDPPIDHAELCARIRFRLDEPLQLNDEERASRERLAREHMARLHATGVRVTPTLTPLLHAKLAEVCGRLLIHEPPRLYVEEHPLANASAVQAGTRCHMTVTSALVNLLSNEEVGSIIGHELGHIGLKHATREPNHRDSHHFMLERSRSHEVSADRVGMVACGDLRTAVSAMIKTASGLASSQIALDIDAFLKQLQESPEDADAEWEAEQTHPLLPFRVWAMTRFGATDLYRALIGQEGGEPFEAVEDEVCVRFHSIGEGLAARQATDHVHEALAWLGALSVLQDGKATEDEEVTLATLVGTIWATDVVEYHRNLGRRAVQNRARQSLAALMFSSAYAKRRLRDNLNRFLERSGSAASRDEVQQMIAEAWSS